MKRYLSGLGGCLRRVNGKLLGIAGIAGTASLASAQTPPEPLMSATEMVNTVSTAVNPMINGLIPWILAVFTVFLAAAIVMRMSKRASR